MKAGQWMALCGALLLPSVAAADPIAGSATQVGAWRVSAYTRGPPALFDHCSLYRVQNQGFGVAIGYTRTASGRWRPRRRTGAWRRRSPTPRRCRSAGTTYTATGRAFGARGMTFNVAPEIFGQLKSGQQLTVSANQKRYAISLDGIEPAQQRARDCVTQYAPQRAPPAQSGAVASGRAVGRRRRPRW